MFNFYYVCNMCMTMVFYWYLSRWCKMNQKICLLSLSIIILSVNLLHLANPRNFNNTVCLSILSFTIYFIFISECVLLYYIIIGFFILYYFYYICRQSISQHFCLFVLYNTFGWKRQPLSFRMNIDKDPSNNGWIWMTMFYTTSRMLNLWEMMVSHHVTRKTSIVLLDFDWCFCKTRGHCCKPHCIDKYKSIYFCF